MGGDIASVIAVEHPMSLDADSHQAGELLGLVCDAVQTAHTEFVTLSSQDPDLASPGTICIGTMRSGNKLVMIHVGDSRVRMLHDSTLAQVTTNHTSAEYSVETGRLTRDQARQHLQHSVLLRVLGDAEGEVQSDKSIREAVPGDCWLLCSDGLSGPMTTETIGKALAGVVDPGWAADQLIDLALRAGGPDDVIAVAFDVVKDDPEPQTMSQVVDSAAAGHLAQERAATARRAGDEQAEVKDAEAADPAVGAAAPMATLENKLEATFAKESSEAGEAIAAEVATQEKARRRHCRRVLTGSLVLSITLVGASALFYRWVQTRYHVPTYKDEVAIYQGTPQSVGPLKLNHSVETYANLPVKSLDHSIRERLEVTTIRLSMSAAETYADKMTHSYRKQAPAPRGTANPTAKPSSSSSPTPSLTPVTPTQPAKPGQEG